MLEPLDALPEGVIGFEAVGTVTAEDYEDQLAPAIEAGAANGQIRFVYVLGDRFDRYSAGASWQDTKLGFGHWSAWERTALVTTTSGPTASPVSFGWMMPGRFRRFSLAELPAAIAWAAEPTP